MRQKNPEGSSFDKNDSLCVNSYQLNIQLTTHN